MKITTDDKLYITKTDLLYLKELKYPLPKDIASKVYRFVILGEETTSDFVTFDQVDEISFLSQLDWILEYKDIVNMTIDDINRVSEAILEEQSSLSERSANGIDMIY